MFNHPVFDAAKWLICQPKPETETAGFIRMDYSPALRLWVDDDGWIYFGAKGIGHWSRPNMADTLRQIDDEVKGGADAAAILQIIHTSAKHIR